MKKLIIAFGILLGIGTAGVVYGSPFTFLVPATTSNNTSTTTTSYMTAGLATTTLTCDSYSVTCVTTGAIARPLGYNRAILLLQMVASTTGTTLRINTEYSQDGIDWYQDGGAAVENFATTTKPFDVSQVAQYNLNFASSTAGLGAVPNVVNSTTTRAIILKTPTRFIRAIFTVPIGSGAVGVWAQMTPSRDTNF